MVGFHISIQRLLEKPGFFFLGVTQLADAILPCRHHNSFLESGEEDEECVSKALRSL